MAIIQAKIKSALCHKENTVDWNDQKYAEIWRHSWETVTNRYLEAAGRPERVDLRSFERQGIVLRFSRFKNRQNHDSVMQIPNGICKRYFSYAV